MTVTHIKDFKLAVTLGTINMVSDHRGHGAALLGATPRPRSHSWWHGSETSSHQCDWLGDHISKRSL